MMRRRYTSTTLGLASVQQEDVNCSLRRETVFKNGRRLGCRNRRRCAADADADADVVIVFVSVLLFNREGAVAFSTLAG